MLIAATMAALALVAPTDKVAVPEGPVVQDATETYQNQETLRCITEHLGLHSDNCDPSDAYQYWNVHVWADNTRQIKGLVSGLCFDDSGPTFVTRPCWAPSDPRSRYQSWYVTRWNDGTIQLRNQATGRCIDDMNSLHTAACYPGSDARSRLQSWF
ncbi:hypothetical protein Lesp02_58200 [Lentzea sp. NBRC 105346]|uniref:RICIN domain-containing protein n=1 Tax=Lentzea sp. NBRC 105346 TaxID=3032205 RepID=UPI00249FCDD9|nr:hypothetical protein [Lentzea sp. NBRC 105346]GLZ33632.1 hypothetical protein Lesp02_58200 [Lentzea sp. NBRC 105346]